MAMILDAFVGFFVDRLGALVEEEIVMLLGVKDDLLALKSTLETMKAVLEDAESKKIQEKAISLWLGRLREVMYDADDLIDDCRLEAEKHSASSSSPAAGRSRSFCSCFCVVPFRHQIGKRIQQINSALEKMAKDTPAMQLVRRDSSGGGSAVCRADLSVRRDNSPLIVESDIVGIDDDAKRLVELLTGGNTRKSKCPIYAITGMGGIGKTTLAQKVFNNAQVRSHFELTIWVCVSKVYEDADILKEIIRAITPKDGRERGRGEVYGEANRTGELVPILRDLVESKRFLLVLDDIWDDRVWEKLLRTPLISGDNDGRILITTRNEKVAITMGVVYTHRVKELPEKEGWSILCKVVFRDDADEGEIKGLKSLGMEIVKKCNGLPLAIKAVGGLLKTKARNVAVWEQIRSSRIWQLPGLPEEIKPGLLLSYEDLPSHLKQCFIYCSLFPEDFKFHQPNLVQMWIAEGFMKAEGELEELGDEHYRELVMRNLLQAMPDYYDGSGCKMHDLIRSLTLHMSQNEMYIYMDRICVKPRHLSFVKKELDAVPEITKNMECLRTLLLSRNPLIKTISAEVFEKLQRLRVLDLTYTGIENLPDSLGNLIHLRFLNISFTKLRGLPESIRNLRNLETLKANGSKFLRKLPEGMSQLQNLRHLTVGATDTQLDYMPGGTGRLVNLRTLNGFVANDDNVSEEKQNVCNMGELKNLSQLTHLSMYKLERVASKGEAEEATLGDKTRLKYLRLSCTRRPKTHQFDVGEIKRIEEVFEALSPPANSVAIHIEGFFGQKLPSCVARCTLHDLTWLRLDDCKLVKQLPPLGQLRKLIVLQIWGATAVSRIGAEFFGGASGFPKLQDLYLWGMTKLEQVSRLERGALPCLKKLHIIKCPRLKALPDGLQHATNLKQLVIEDAESLKVIGNLTSVSELTTKGNTKLKAISSLPALDVMNVGGCPALDEVTSVGVLSYVLLSDDKIKALPKWLAYTTALKRLDVKSSAHLVTRCCKGGADWSLIENVLHVEARSIDGSSFISYRKEPFSFQSNLTENSVGDLSSSFHNTTASNAADEEYPSFTSPYEP